MIKFEVWLYAVQNGREVLFGSSIVLATDPVSALMCMMEETRKDGMSPNQFTRIDIIRVPK